jgi:hypothetical protein
MEKKQYNILERSNQWFLGQFGYEFGHFSFVNPGTAYARIFCIMGYIKIEYKSRACTLTEGVQQGPPIQCIQQGEVHPYTITHCNNYIATLARMLYFPSGGSELINSNNFWQYKFVEWYS